MSRYTEEFSLFVRFSISSLKTATRWVRALSLFIFSDPKLKDVVLNLNSLPMVTCDIVVFLSKQQMGHQFKGLSCWCQLRRPFNSMHCSFPSCPLFSYRKWYILFVKTIRDQLSCQNTYHRMIPAMVLHHAVISVLLSPFAPVWRTSTSMRLSPAHVLTVRLWFSGAALCLSVGDYWFVRALGGHVWV